MRRKRSRLLLSVIRFWSNNRFIGELLDVTVGAGVTGDMGDMGDADVVQRDVGERYEGDGAGRGGRAALKD